MKKFNWVVGLVLLLAGCNQRNAAVPTVGFVDAFEDNTIAQAKKGFLDALAQKGFSEDKKTIQVVYRNAQGNIPTLTQIVKYFNTEKVSLIATCPSLATITAIQNTKEIPVFMMVSPTPSLMKVVDNHGNPPSNLFGVGEETNYIDTSFSLIPTLVSPKNGILNVGMIYNQSEPQSVEALKKIQSLAASLHINLSYIPVNSTADVSLVTQSLLNKHLDAFFANPDNTVFASFENIIKDCNKANVPVFTSEAGLVARGAVAAFGADIYQWGFQAGLQAATYLQNKTSKDIHWEMVKRRKRVYNAAVAKQFHILPPKGFEAL